MSENDELVTVLKDIRRWVKLIGLEDAREKVNTAVTHDDDAVERENKIIYNLTNGESSTRSISEYVSVSKDTVNNRQQDWAKLGLVEKAGPNEPYQKLITLEEAGLDVPDIPDTGEEETSNG